MSREGPLRYPGAKGNLAAFVGRFLQKHRLVGTSLLEPFGGSAAVSRFLLSKGLVRDATIWEADPGAFAFWEAALNDTSALQSRLAEAQVNLREFDRCREYLWSINDLPSKPVEAGYCFLFLNRTSYSGIVGAGPIGGRSQSSAYPIDCRFNKGVLIDQIGRLGRLRGKLHARFGDGIVAVEQAEDDVTAYADPPYFTNGKKFYRKYFSVLDHYRLRRALASRSGKWLLSYDYDRKVEYLYRAYPTAEIGLFHSAREAGSKRELLVSPLGFRGLGLDHTEETASGIEAGLPIG